MSEPTQAVGAPLERHVRPLVERLQSRAWEDRHHRKYREEAARVIDAALHEAIAAVYFDDGSDFRPALLRIVSILGGPSCLELLETNPRACYAASAA